MRKSSKREMIDDQFNALCKLLSSKASRQYLDESFQSDAPHILTKLAALSPVGLRVGRGLPLPREDTNEQSSVRAHLT